MKLDPDTIATLLADPSRADAIRREEIPAALGRVEELRAALTMRMLTPAPSPDQARSDIEKAAGDTLLTAKEAAARIGVDRRWIYRRADSLPFTRRLGERTLRFSERGLTTWLESRT